MSSRSSPTPMPAPSPRSASAPSTGVKRRSGRAGSSSPAAASRMPGCCSPRPASRRQASATGTTLSAVIFMDHPHALAAYAVRKADLERFELYYGEIKQDGAVLHAKPGLSEKLQREQKLLNGCVDLGYGYDRSTGYLALRDMKQSVAQARLGRAFGHDLMACWRSRRRGRRRLSRGLARGGAVARLELRAGAGSGQPGQPRHRTRRTGHARASSSTGASPSARKRNVRPPAGSSARSSPGSASRVCAWIPGSSATIRNGRASRDGAHHMGTTRMSDDRAPRRRRPRLPRPRLCQSLHRRKLGLSDLGLCQSDADDRRARVRLADHVKAKRA